MRVELINTGAELMLGRVLNSHQQWLCRQFADLGQPVERQVAVDDSGPAIVGVVREALGRADVIVTTGGLGPTSDDRTRDLIAELLQRPLHDDDAVRAHITGFFASRGRPLPASTLVQAQVPAGATVLMNDNGTAPGLALELGTREGLPQVLVMLPGPPRELRPMFTRQVVPWLRARMPFDPTFVCRTLRTTGIGESRLEELVADPLRHLTNAGLELGYCARTGEVDLRFVMSGSGAGARVAEAEAIVRRLVGARLYGSDDETLEQVVVGLLTRRRETVALAESCTGGAIAHRLTNVPGASAVFWGGMVTYANDAKERLLGVQAATLAAHGAVSEATVCEMAAGARLAAGSTYSLAVTGIAGPGGGSDQKPVGTVFVGLAGPEGVQAQRYLNAFDRETFKYVTTQQALDLLRRTMSAGVAE